MALEKNGNELLASGPFMTSFLLSHLNDVCITFICLEERLQVTHAAF